MWTRKDLILMSLAATTTFAVTTSVFISQLAQAAPTAAVAKTIQSPTLKLGDCELRASTTPIPGQAKAPDDANPTFLAIVAGTKLPPIKLTVANPSKQAATVSFSAALLASNGKAAAMSRSGPGMSEEWSKAYTLDLKAGETREVELPLKATMKSGGYAMLRLTNSVPPKDKNEVATTISAMTFNSAPADRPGHITR